MAGPEPGQPLPTGLGAAMELLWGMRERPRRGPKPGLTLLRLRTGDLSALARRLAERDVPCEENAVGLVVAPGPGRGAPLIVEPVR